MKPPLLLLAVLAPLLLAACGDAPAPAADAAPLAYDVQGMHCEGCAGLIAQSLGELPGVQTATASYARSEAVILPKPGQAPDPGLLLETLEGLGYRAVPRP